jgi:hypothetical protein
MGAVLPIRQAHGQMQCEYIGLELVERLRPEIHGGTRFRAQQDCAPTNVLWDGLWVYPARRPYENS